MIDALNEDPGLRWVECMDCKNLECAANLQACVLCLDDGDRCLDCLETHKEQNHTEEETQQFWREVLEGNSDDR